MSEQIVVPFEGDIAGVGELTWGQWEIWPSLRESHTTSFSIGGWAKLPPGRTAADIADDLQFLMSRHSSLRTRLQFAADGRPQQAIARSGKALLEVIDSGDADPAAVAADVYTRLDSRSALDCAGDWPIRWAVIVSRGTASYLVSLISHLAADGEGVRVILDDLASRDPVTGLGAGPVTAIQPLDLARLQASAAGMKQGDAALRRWEQLLRMVPARKFPGPAYERPPRFQQTFYDSPASFLAVQTVAARTKVSTGTVLLAAYAVAQARLTGTNPAVVQLVVNNRFRPGFKQVVSQLCHFGLCVIDVAGITIDEAVSRARGSAMSAYKIAYCDPLRRRELVARIGRERGEEPDIGACFVNDRRMEHRQEPGEQPPGPAEVLAARPSTLFTGYQNNEDSGERCYLHINDEPDTIRYELLADTRDLSPANIEAFLRGIEAVIVEAALDPAAPTGVGKAG
jgi:Condensation domain